jgi:AcrR family transcriptional regulator
MGSMPRAVKRSYDATTREARSAQTRQRIIDTARQLIIERGYRATTLAAIADQAGVHVDTVYSLVGRKPVLLTEIIEQALSGSDHVVAAEARDHVRAIRAESDAARMLDIYAHALRETHGRLAPVFVALRDVSATDPDARAVWQAISARRAANMTAFVRQLRAVGGLRTDLSIAEAADTVWVTNSPEVYVLLTGERGWTPDRYEQWLADSWRRLLL